jgi:hypothetical protein
VRGSGGGFFDGESLDPDVGVDIVLRRVLVDGRERFHMVRRIAYHDPAHPAAHVVPLDPAGFVTDLTSVPAVFAWLVPRSGVHLPAALLHDALVAGPDQYRGPRIERLEADRIFRDSMASLGTSLARRWLMWAAVVLATIWLGRLDRAWWYRSVMIATLGGVAVLGLISTLQIAGAVSWLGWLDAQSIPERLGRGLMAAVAVPAALSLLWWRLWPVGLITGVALALLLHVTVVLGVLIVGFQAIEAVSTAVVERRRDRGVSAGAGATSDTDVGIGPVGTGSVGGGGRRGQIG